MIIQSKQKFLWYTYYSATVLAPEGFDPYTENCCIKCNEWIGDIFKREAGGYHYYAYDPNNLDKILAQGVCESVEQGQKFIEQTLEEKGFIC